MAAKIRPVPVVLIAFYCFFMALFFLSAMANTAFGGQPPASTDMLVLIVADIIFAAMSVVLGIGILYYNQLCWKILFFNLMISISTMASLVLVVLILIVMDARVFFKFFSHIHINRFTWISFIALLMSAVIVLYYLTREEILECFGDMGELIDPF